MANQNNVLSARLVLRDGTKQFLDITHPGSVRHEFRPPLGLGFDKNRVLKGYTLILDIQDVKKEES